MQMLIIQTGDATAAARPYGNFDDWFHQAVPNKTMRTVKVHQGENLPDSDWTKNNCSHIIVTGSADMVTEHKDWMVKTQHWLADNIEMIPTLGVCFGHQLLADLLGGKVSYNPKGRNMGFDVCELTTEGMTDSLFAYHNQIKMNTWVSHLQTVEKLPISAVRLASCQKDNNHAFRYKNHVYGVQFHPEWNREIMQAYIRDREDTLSEEGHNTVKMLQAASNPVNGLSLIQQFINKMY